MNNPAALFGFILPFSFFSHFVSHLYEGGVAFYMFVPSFTTQHSWPVAV